MAQKKKLSKRNYQKEIIKKKCNAPLRKMLAPGKKRGTSVTRWLPYRDGNRLTKVVLGDVEVVLAKYYPWPPLIYWIAIFYEFYEFIYIYCATQIQKYNIYSLIRSQNKIK